MRVLIVDDEPLARQWLRHLIEDLGPAFQVVGEAADGAEALSRCRTEAVDVALMDIRMPGMSGMESAARLSDLAHPPAVIFTTAYEEHALQAFDQHAVDYLLKPVRAERLLRALERARILNLGQQEVSQPVDDAVDAARSHLCTHFRGCLQRIPLEDVIYFRADSKYVTVRHLGGEILVDEPLKSLEVEFGDRFIRIHRNALVARQQLAGIGRDPDGQTRIRLRDCPERLEVSRRHQPKIRRWLRRGSTD